jgi:uncharacterized protein HemX
MKRWHWYLIGLAVVLIALFLFGWKAASILGGIGAGGYALLNKKVEEGAKKEEEIAEEVKEQTDKNEKVKEEIEKEQKETKEKVESIIKEQEELRKEKEKVDDDFESHFKE